MNKVVLPEPFGPIKPTIAPGGQVRFQLRAVLTDTEGIVVPEDFIAVADAEQQENEPDLLARVRAAGEDDLVADGYMGHPFTYREAAEMTRSIYGKDAAVLRLDRAFILGGWTRTG